MKTETPRTRKELNAELKQVLKTCKKGERAFIAGYRVYKWRVDSRQWSAAVKALVKANRSKNLQFLTGLVGLQKKSAAK